MTMRRPNYIFGQFRETVRCRDVQHGDGICCAFAPQLVKPISVNVISSKPTIECTVIRVICIALYIYCQLHRE